MKEKNNIKMWNDKEWAEAASRLSREEGGNMGDNPLLINEEPSVMKEWDSLRYPDEEVIDVDKAWQKVNSMIEAEDGVLIRQRAIFPITLARVAAMVIILAGAGWIFFKVATPKKITVLSSAIEKNIEVHLTDGSMIYLNRNSRLTYPKSFSGDSRRVTLSGEAFFDIASDPELPFIIDAGKATIKVEGTSFNVITRNSNNKVEVYVSSGKVRVNSDKGGHTVTLEPGDIGEISETGSILSRNNNPNYLAWHTGMLYYDGERLSEVFRDLKRIFNIEIKVTDPEINDYSLTSPFEHQPHDTIVKLICTTFNLRYVREGETYTLSR